MRNRKLPFLLTLALTCFAATACMEPASTKADASTFTQEDEEQKSVDVAQARAIVFQAELEEYEKLSEADRQRNDEIHTILQNDRIAVVTAGLPDWVKEQLVNFESRSPDFGHAFSRSVAWGTGTYKGRPFYWFAHTNSDAWLQMNLSVALDKKDIDALYGRRPDDLEGGEENPNRQIDVKLGTEIWSDPEGIETHIGMRKGVDWMSEFCTKPDMSRCDTAGAFEKHFLPLANAAIPGLSFKLVGRFSY